MEKNATENLVRRFAEELAELPESELAEVLSQFKGLPEKMRRAADEAKAIRAKPGKGQEAFEKAKRMVCAPYNEENERIFKTLFQTVPEYGDESLVKVCCEYLMSKERVDASWLFLLMDMGLSPTPDDAMSMMDLAKKRSKRLEGYALVGSLGERFPDVLCVAFQQKADWARLEREHGYVPGNDAKGLLDSMSELLSHSDEAVSAATHVMEGGCRSENDEVLWVKVIGKSTNKQTEADRKNICEAKIAFVRTLCDLGLKNSTAVRVDYRMRLPGVQPNAGTSVMVPLSMGFIRSGRKDESFLPILGILIDSEGGGSICDVLGRKRIFHVNMALWDELGHEQVLMRAAKLCMEHGDKPEDIHRVRLDCATPGDGMAKMLTAAMEAEELGVVMGNGGKTTAKRGL